MVDRDLERYEKENAVLRQVLRETNQRLEEKIHEFSLFRMVTDTINHLMTQENPLKALLSKVIELVEANNGSIMLLDEVSRELRVAAASGTKDASPTYPAFPVGRGVAGWVALENKPALLADVEHSDRFYRSEQGGSQIRSLLCLPLQFENQTIGVLNVSSDHPNAFTLNSERILHIIAGQIAVAIVNTRFWNEQKRREQALQRKNEELIEMKRQLEQASAQLLRAHKLEAVKEIAVSVHHEINNPLTTIYSCTQLLEAHIDESNTSGKESLAKIKESCQQIKEIVFKLSNLQDVVLTDYVAEHKMIDIDRSFNTAERVKKNDAENSPSPN